MAEVFNKAVVAVEFLAAHLETLGAILAGIAVAKTVSFFVDLGVAIGGVLKSLQLVGAAVLANPFALIGVAIAAAVAALIIYRDELVDGWRAHGPCGRYH